MGSSSTPKEPGNVLYRIKRGLAGYVSYLAACEMNEAFSEYVLYEPILRILTARGFTAHCEVPCPGLTQGPVGDVKKLDFVAERNGVHFAIETKWARARRLNVDRDLEKLRAFRTENHSAKSFLCVFGRKKHINKLSLSSQAFHERGKPVFAEFGVTRYGCRVFQLGK
jgi:Holliday junction resolvase